MAGAGVTNEVGNGGIGVMRRALVDDFGRLHPRLQQQFGIDSSRNVAFIGEGRMEYVQRGIGALTPFLRLGAKRSVMFPEAARDVPFSIRHFAFVDPFGRETFTLARTFLFPGIERRFDETMIYSETRKRLVIYAGTHQHLAVEVRMAVHGDGLLNVTTDTQRLYEWRLGMRIPLLFAGRAFVRMAYNGQMDRYEIELAIRNPCIGLVFGYKGQYTGSVVGCLPEEIDATVRPMRYERRE